MKKFILDFKKASGGKRGDDWNIPLKRILSGHYDVYEEDGELYQNCPFCGHQNKYMDWVCSMCNAQ